MTAIRVTRMITYIGDERLVELQLGKSLPDGERTPRPGLHVRVETLERVVLTESEENNEENNDGD